MKQNRENLSSAIEYKILYYVLGLTLVSDLKTRNFTIIYDKFVAD
jgi:hypothetical protein